MINPFTHRKILKKGTAARATIAAIGTPARGSTSFNLAMTLHVYIEGVAPYEVEDQWMVKAKDFEALSGSIPVKVDPDERDRVAIDWDLLREESEQEKEARRQALAAQGPVDASSFGSGGVPGAFEVQFGGAEVQAVTPVVDMRNDPELRAKIEQVLGRKLTPGSTEAVAENDPALQMRIMQVVQEHVTGQAAAAAWQAPPPPAPGGGDTLARLERLAALRASGALTEQEFEEQKRRVLQGG